MKNEQMLGRFGHTLYSLICILLLINAGCKSTDPVTPIPADQVDISTDKAIYRPGESVTFSIAHNVGSPLIVRYKFLNELIEEISLNTTSWTWKPPNIDFRGYLAEVSLVSNSTEQILGTIAVDISSDWGKFPRYGFLSKFHELSAAEMDANMQRLARHHINGIQFYDWSEKHHKPLAGTVSQPSEMWLDIANRPTYKTTVENYIAKAHQYNIKAMFYNLCNGVLEDAGADGVSEFWYLYKNTTHSEKVVFDIGSFLKSPIYLMDPSNTSWQQFLAARNADVYDVFTFDGFHIDQLGDLGNVYGYYANSIDLTSAYKSFASAMYTAQAARYLIFNAVNQFGQQNGIAASPVHFLYTEVWSPNEDYADLVTLIEQNDLFSAGQKKSVLAAYVNYDLANQPGSFNSSSVLFADAVIFAFGGSHIELGEHMLGQEYFPNNNLTMMPDLKSRLITFYDFLVAYENLLRDGGQFNSGVLSSKDNKVEINPWPPQIGNVACIGRRVNQREVFHLINFINASTLQWRDNTGIQTKPEIVEDFEVKFTSLEQAKKVWFASPDLKGGASNEIDFDQDGIELSFKIPYLEYWSMIVVEY